MMKEFSIGCSRTINLGNFESVRVEASVTMIVPEPKYNNEDEHLVLRRNAQIELRKLLEETYRNQYADRKKIA